MFISLDLRCPQGDNILFQLFRPTTGRYGVSNYNGRVHFPSFQTLYIRDGPNQMVQLRS